MTFTSKHSRSALLVIDNLFEDLESACGWKAGYRESNNEPANIEYSISELTTSWQLGYTRLTLW